ncbi:PP0621 family protein [Massilia sp. DWR3-1-1]|uniref:PP0621 family protein n=1 Tax=Massilia sp. DWR3-1-1 TaxID=2804559 RepID=UPI003CE9AF6B
MSRLLFWLALAVLVVFAIRAKIQAARARADRANRFDAAPGAVSPAEGGEAMTSCAHCGLYFPASEAVRADGLDYCCPAHVRLPAP